MKKNHSNRFVNFFAGKGFYVVLLVCVTVIGLSGYALFFPGAGGTKDYIDSLGLSDSQGDPDWDLPSSWSDANQSLPPATPMWEDDEYGGFDSQAVIGGNIAPPSLAPAPPTQTPAAPQTGIPPSPEPAERSGPSQSDSYVWPVSGRVIHEFSQDELVFNQTMGDWRVHRGIDIETAASALISAISSGVVEDIYEDPLLGTTVVITHEGDIRSVYANLSKTPTVAKGDSVGAGDTIGAVGGTALGESFETTHLHLEVYKGESMQDPLDYLPQV